MKSFLIIAASATGALATYSLKAHALFPRQYDCSAEGMQDCGTGCIPLSATCCPDASGGCLQGDFCILGDNNEYGCCPDGDEDICSGPGGATTTTGSPDGGYYSTEYSTVTSEASTLYTTETEPASTMGYATAPGNMTTMTTGGYGPGPTASNTYYMSSGGIVPSSTPSPSSVPVAGAPGNRLRGASLFGGIVAVAAALVL